MQGKIIKGIAGFYYVFVVGAGLYECKAKGVFRNKSIKPLVGDNVIIEVIDEDNKIGNIIEICERKNSLIRPAVANVDNAVVIFAVKKPSPNFNLLDKFLISMVYQDIHPIICFNKEDISDEDEINKIKDEYEKSGFEVLFTSAKEGIGIEELKGKLKGKTSTVAGPSGVGKSSIINLLQSAKTAETGAISDKIDRGKHTTRHSEIIPIDEDSYIIDTPGFTSFAVTGIEAEELKNYYPEFVKRDDKCRFGGCVHINEPDCEVKDALEKGEISRLRYNNYVAIYEELKAVKKY